MNNMLNLTSGGGYFSCITKERRQGTGLILSPWTLWEGGLRRKDGGDPSWL